MTDRENDAVKALNFYVEHYSDSMSETFKEVLNVIKNKQNRITELEQIEEAHRELNSELRKELQLKDKIVMDIVKRLDNDIKNITETKADGYTDDYRRCRLKAYRTKTREIKEYIVKEYFTKKASDETG